MAGLDATLRRLTGYCLRRATSQVLVTVNETLAAFALRRTTFTALTVVVDNPGLRQSQLAGTLNIERANLVQIVHELEAAGLVTRQRVPEDKRVYTLSPTQEGTDLHRRALRQLCTVDAALTRGLSAAETQALRRALLLVEGNASKENLHGSRLPGA
ncbi:MAG: MarR family transcriptional regulator [Pseudomonadota bacterium]